MGADTSCIAGQRCSRAPAADLEGALTLLFADLAVRLDQCLAAMSAVAPMDIPADAPVIRAQESNGNADQEQDEAALVRLMDTYGSAVLRVCYLYLRDYDQAQDAAQTTFLKVWKNLHTLREGATEKAWVMAIAANTCKSVRRSREFRLYAKNTPFDQLPEPTAEDKLPDDTVLNAVFSLPDKYREVVVLHYYQGLPLTEVAQILHIPHASVRTRLHRARKLLVPVLKGWYLGDDE